MQFDYYNCNHEKFDKVLHCYLLFPILIHFKILENVFHIFFSSGMSAMVILLSKVTIERFG